MAIINNFLRECNFDKRLNLLLLGVVVRNRLLDLKGLRIRTPSYLDFSGIDWTQTVGNSRTEIIAQTANLTLYRVKNRHLITENPALENAGLQKR